MFKKWVYLVVVATTLVLLLVVAKGLHLKSKLLGFSTISPATQNNPAQTASPSASTNIKIFTLTLKDKKLVSGPEILQVTEGDNVQINITSDIEEQLHLHGYDKSVDLQANKPTQLHFIANLTGRFTYELEKSKIEIGALEVTPK